MTKQNFDCDRLDRTKVAKAYVDFINELDNNHTIALDAPWGSGKTKTIEFMCTKFKENKDLFINYNAWENDYTDDPFLSLMSQFFIDIVKKDYVGENKLENTMARAWTVSKHIGKGLFKGAAKVALGSEALEELSEAGEELAKGVISEATNAAINKAFKDIDKSKKSRETFTEELRKTIRTILGEKSKKKFIIIIDELDRCKPSFAIELLENIKHLFPIKEIVFLISVDKIQLAESIKAIYGQGFDAITYLQRFFDFEIHLPKQSSTNYFRFKLLSIFNIKDDSLAKSIQYAHDNFDLTIRDYERILSETYISHKLNNIDISENYPYTSVLVLLLILKQKEPFMYDIINNNLEKDLKTHQQLLKNDWPKYREFIGDELIYFYTKDDLLYENNRLKGYVKASLKKINNTL